jgi:triacylglycerol esterase/lipase EstA (alpha/beta hydrolase family)
MMRHAWMMLLVLAPLCLPARASDDPPTFSIPLDGGRLHVRDILRQAADRLGAEDLAALEAIDWSIDVQSLAGRMQITALERMTGRAFDIDVRADCVEVRIDKPRLAELLTRTDRTTQRWLTDLAKFDAQSGMREMWGGRFGLTFVTAEDARAPADALTEEMKQRVVVLVHGLDDPGMMWSDIVPALHAAGYTVARFDYPNDGPISDSADLLADCLRDAKAAGIERLDIVAHSMGGLVVRDVLTRPAYYNGDGSGQSAGSGLPAIDRFIMCGTPNHGSQMVRLRGIIELREHVFTALATGESLRDLSAIDGQGEAGVDLLPGSEFLRRLNARPLATHTQHTIIAARLSPVEGERAKWLAGKVRSLASSSMAPSWLHDYAVNDVAKSIEQATDHAIDGLGDGCVSMESAKLDDVQDVTTVRATHLGMILNIGGGREMPPAIPIVLDRLERPLDSTADALLED